MNKLQEIELSILKECIKIFKEHNINYYVIGGTLLGAVRHKGFIPWDDDIDLGLPRKDYEKFIKIAQLELPEPLVLQHFTNEKKSVFSFAKVRNKKTIMKQYNIKDFKINHGVYIDIFPIDYYNKSLTISFLLFLLKIKRRTLIKNKLNSFKEIIYYIPNKLLFLFLFPIRISFLLKITDNKISKNKKLSMVTNYYGIYGKKEIVPSLFFENGLELEFEDIKVQAPCKYDLYLKRIYGDYLKLPPLEKQKSHHDCIEVNLDYEK